MAFNPPQSVCVKRSPGKGRGVFAKTRIVKGELIERSPTVVIEDADLNESLQRYCYDTGKAVIGLGYLSLYNHTRHPNADQRDCGSNTIEIIALRNIDKGEEITINYGESYAEEEWY